jgi:menaquinone-dependent protoporphyrinogen oxidase
MKGQLGIYFATRHCQTQKIANYLGQWFRQRQVEVKIFDLAGPANNLQDPLNFDAVLIGAPVYMRCYPREVARFVRKNRATLVRVPCTGFFSVCLAATPATPEAYVQSLGPVKAFLDDVAWNPRWIASFPGALNYRVYNPILRWIMKKISAAQGGPTDVRNDYFLTRWDEVSEFATDLLTDEPQSRYRAEKVLRATGMLNALMPDFEHRIVQRLLLHGTLEEVRVALETMELEDMPLASALAWIRNLGRKSPNQSPHTLFHDSAEAFGSLPILSNQPHEVMGALIGQFWKRDFGIHRLGNIDEFRGFAESGYVKVLTNFWFEESCNYQTVVRTETRIHAMDAEAARKFGLYWLAVSPGIRLYMRSVLHGIRASLDRRRWRRNAGVATQS